MHKSRFCSVVIDCNVDDVDADADAGPDRELETDTDELILLVQKVDHPSRVHLDIETDDLEAEVRRLEALGATRVGFVQRWWVMQAPTGQRQCGIQPQRGTLAR